MQNRPISLILQSPSRYGKTEWARSLGKHMYFNGYFNMDEWDESALYIIFDDVPWERVPVRKSFFGAQKQFVLTDKYRKKMTVKFGKPTIYLCNNDPYVKDIPEDEASWYKTNTVHIKLNEKLF